MGSTGRHRQERKRRHPNDVLLSFGGVKLTRRAVHIGGLLMFAAQQTVEGPGIFVSDQRVDRTVPRFVGPPPVRETYRRRRMQVVAHGIDGKDHLETVEDVVRAIASGAEGFDLDTRRTFDAMLVVYHDGAMTKDGRLFPIEATHSGPALQVRGVETLEHMYGAAGPNRSVCLDMKRVYEQYGDTFGTPRDAMLLVAKMLEDKPERQKNTRIWLDDPEDVKEFSCRLPNVQIGLSPRKDVSVDDAIAAAEANYANAISLDYEKIKGRPDLVQKAHDAKLFVYVWNVPDTFRPDETHEYEHALRLGVDAINADNIRLARDLAESISDEWGLAA